MSENTLKARLVHPCKTDAEWASSNPVAKKGEIMISSDKSGMFKVGNGTNKWSDLQYNHVTWENVEGKPSTFSPSAHTHTKSQITDFPSSMPASDVYAWAKASSKPSYSWGEITGKPSSFTPSSHAHSQYYDSGQSRTANTVLAAPNGSAGTATFRKLVAADIPALSYLPLSGGTVTGDLKVNASVSTNGLEIYHTSTPFIDFHYGNDSTIDYTSRIIENAKGVLNINGTCCTSGGSLWCTSFSTDGNIAANGGTIHCTNSGSNEAQVHAHNNLRDVYLCASSSGRAGIYDTKHGWIIFNDGDAATTYIQECTIKNNNLTVPGSIDAKHESHFYLASAGYSDPLPGVTCPLKVSGIAAATRFYVVGRSGTWLSSAQPGGAGFECVNDKNDSALIPGWRIRNQSGAWVGASYNMDKAFHLYYAKAERLSGNTDNGTDADFIFNAKTGNFSAKSITQTSDERRKSIISSSILNSYKDFFMKIKPFSFKWKDGQDDTATHLGVGAQSVFHTALECGFEENDIGLVQRGKEYPGTSIPWSVSYTEFIPLNIAVTQDHEIRIEKLERENEELKQQIKELKGLTA